MDTKALREQLERALNDTAGLPDTDIGSIGVLIRAGEWAIALEALCTQIAEYEIVTSDEQKARIDHLGRLLEVRTDDLL